jgi:membrane protein CcdC involved in cytochrome C biogenesis
MRKAIKIVMILIMLLGIAFSISNFISVELKANHLNGLDWVWPDGAVDCIRIGGECTFRF